MRGYYVCTDHVCEIELYQIHGITKFVCRVNFIENQTNKYFFCKWLGLLMYQTHMKVCSWENQIYRWLSKSNVVEVKFISNRMGKDNQVNNFVKLELTNDLIHTYVDNQLGAWYKVCGIEFMK